MSDIGRHGRNVSWLFAAELAQKVLSLALFVYLTRKLDVHGNSAYGVVATVLPFFVTLLNMGYYEVLVRDIAKRPDDARSFMANAIAGQSALFVPVLIVVCIAVQWTNFSDTLETIVVLAVVTALLHAITKVHYAALAAHEQFRAISTLNIWLRFAIVCVSLTLLYLDFGVVALVACYIPCYALQVLLARRSAIATTAANPVEWSATRQRYLVREGAPMAVSGIVASCYFALDLPLLEGYGHGAIAGHYAIGLRFLLLMMTFSDLIAAVLYPIFSRKAMQSADDQRAALGIGLKASALFAVPALIGIAVLNHGVVALIAGPANLPSAPAVLGFTFVFLCEMLTRNLVDFLRSHNRQRTPMAIYAVALVAKMIAAFAIMQWVSEPFLPLLFVNVLIAPAIAIAHLIAMRMYRPDLRVPALAVAMIGRPVLAGLAMGFVLLWLKAVPVLLAIVLGGLVYGLFAVLFGAIGSFERDLMRKTLRIG